MQGFLLALEGIDGSGTTTQARRLEERLRAAGYLVHRTAEPSTGPVGRFIREALADPGLVSDEALALLFAADRLDHIEHELTPALARGAVVITDRYLLSSLAYQSSYLPLAWVAEINARARHPDASILLRVSAETAARRRALRGGDEERFDALERQRRIAAAYDRVFALPDVGPTHILDAEVGLAEIARRVDALVDELLVKAAAAGRLHGSPARQGPPGLQNPPAPGAPAGASGAREGRS